MDKILVVDLCDTLYKSNTTQDFFDFIFKDDVTYKRLKKTNSSLIFKIVNKLSNKFLKIDMSRILMTKVLKDKSTVEIQDLVIKFIDEFLEVRKIKKVHEVIKGYKDDGYKVIIISASYDFIVKQIVSRLGFDSYIASQADVLDGKYTGKVSKDLLYTKFNSFNGLYPNHKSLVMITDNTTDYDFVKKTKKSYIVINSRNKEFWSKKKTNKLVFMED